MTQKRKKDKRPAPIVVLNARGIVPVSSGDAEDINEFANGTEFDLVKRSKRSHKHLRTYWKALGQAVKATQISATQEHLHRELKLATGYTEKVINRITDEVFTVPSSIALGDMEQDEFNEYFRASMAMLATWVGYDPLRWMVAA